MGINFRSMCTSAVPNWYHHQGRNMQIKKCSIENSLLIIAGSAAELKLTRKTGTNNHAWYVDWEVRYSEQEKTQGRIIMSTDELRAAFGLENVTQETSQWLVHTYKASCAGQGKFIRTESFLNIPGPGTGHDGDPNISIELDEQIIDAITKLVVS
jgi:hypothetical protein